MEPTPHKPPQACRSYFSPLPKNCPLPLKICHHTCHLKVITASAHGKEKRVLRNPALQWDARESSLAGPPNCTSPQQVQRTTPPSGTRKACRNMLQFASVKCNLVKGTFSPPAPPLPIFHIFIEFLKMEVALNLSSSPECGEWNCY